MLRRIAVAVLVLSVSTAAYAGFTPGVDSLVYSTDVYTLGGQLVGADLPQAHDPTGTTYNVFTGLATAANGLALIEPNAPPIRDDVVNFDGIPEQINEYIAAAGGIRRVVSESSTPLGGSAYQLVITVMGSTQDGNPGDLWPSGFQTGGGVPLTGGGFGIGINLGTALGGADPLTWEPSPTSVTQASIRIRSDGVFGAPISLPLTLFAPSAANWNGVIGLAFGNGATGAAVQDAIELSLTVGKLPEPGSLALLGLGAAMLMRRRHRNA